MSLRRPGGWSRSNVGGIVRASVFRGIVEWLSIDGLVKLTDDGSRFRRPFRGGYVVAYFQMSALP